MLYAVNGRANPSVTDGRDQTFMTSAPRSLHIGDLLSIQGFLTGLDAESRQIRFGIPVSDAALGRHAVQALENASLLLGISSEQKLCAMLELYARDFGVMEAVLVVGPTWRRRGMASRLINASAGWAVGTGAHSLDLLYSTDNWPMRTIAQKTGARVDFAFGAYRARIDLADHQANIKSLPILGDPYQNQNETDEGTTKTRSSRV